MAWNGKHRGFPTYGAKGKLRNRRFFWGTPTSAQITVPQHGRVRHHFPWKNGLACGPVQTRQRKTSRCGPQRWTEMHTGRSFNWKHVHFQSSGFEDNTWYMGVQPADGKFVAMAILMRKGFSNPSHFTARFMFQADGRRFARHWWQNWSTCSLLKQSFEPPREKRWHHGKPNSSIYELVRWRNAAKTWKCSVWRLEWSLPSATSTGICVASCNLESLHFSQSCVFVCVIVRTCKCCVYRVCWVERDRSWFVPHQEGLYQRQFAHSAKVRANFCFGRVLEMCLRICWGVSAWEFDVIATLWCDAIQCMQCGWVPRIHNS